MIDYAPLWTPHSLDEARFQIDTSRYADDAAFWDEGAKIAVRLAPLAPADGTTVEYGCGVGRNLRNMPGKQRIGIDVSPEMLALAYEHSDGPLYVQGDGRTIPLDDDSVDFLYSWLVIQHFDADDTAGLLRETARVLKPGGTCAHLFAGFGARYAPGATLPRALGEQTWDPEHGVMIAPGHEMMGYTPPVIVDLATQAGLTPISIEPVPPMSDWEASEFRRWGYDAPGWEPYWLLTAVPA